MNKNNLLGAIIALGVLAVFFAAWATLTHQVYAKTSMTVAFLVAGIAAASLAWFLFVTVRKKAS